MLDKEYFIGYIMICNGDIRILEEEMKRKEFRYEKHIEFENELELDGENLILQMDRNLVKNFSKERVERVCEAEKKRRMNKELDFQKNLKEKVDLMIILFKGNNRKVQNFLNDFKEKLKKLDR